MGRRLTEEEDKGNAIQDQDVRYVGNASVAKELHLLFCGAHEQETRGIEKLSTVSMLFITRDINGTHEWRKILEAVRIRSISTKSRSISEHERNLNHTSKSSRHERVTEDCMDHCAQHQ